MGESNVPLPVRVHEYHRESDRQRTKYLKMERKIVEKLPSFSSSDPRNNPWLVV